MTQPKQEEMILSRFLAKNFRNLIYKTIYRTYEFDCIISQSVCPRQLMGQEWPRIVFIHLGSSIVRKYQTWVKVSDCNTNTSLLTTLKKARNKSFRLKDLVVSLLTIVLSRCLTSGHVLFSTNLPLNRPRLKLND